MTNGERNAVVGLLLVALTLGCQDSRKSHLEKFLDPQQKPQENVADILDPFALGEKPEMADRIHALTFSDVASRLGAHRFQSSIKYEFKGDDRRISLGEEDLIVLAQNGDFRVKLKNDADQGYEMVYSSNHLYMKDLFGPFHERNLTLLDQVKWRDSVYGGWPAIYRLYRGRLQFSKQRLLKHHGRDAVLYSISLANTEPRLPAVQEAGRVPQGVEKYVYPTQPTAAEKDGWREQARPYQAEGTLLVDAGNAVVLGADFSGTLLVPSPIQKSPLTLTIMAKLQTDGFGNPPSINPPNPEEIKPIPEQISVNTHPIDFFFGEGFTATLGVPAGVAASTTNEANDKKAGGSESTP